jgi:hypothetical protein
MDNNIPLWPEIEDGSRVQHQLSFKRGIAFSKNRKGQYLIRWDDETIDIVNRDWLAIEKN